MRGELRTTEPGGYEHGWLGSRIDRRLGAHVEAHGLGDTTTEIGCKLPGCAYRSANDIRILGDDGTLDASYVVDGWVVRVGDLLG